MTKTAILCAMKLGGAALVAGLAVYVALDASHSAGRPDPGRGFGIITPYSAGQLFR